MKTATNLFLFFILILSSQTFSQVNIRVETDKFIQERINSKSFPTEQIKYSALSGIFKDGESRTIINKTILDNGFLLISQLIESWDGSNWVNYHRSLYTYDVNDNMIELLIESWDGSNWVNYHRSLYTYDVNNNLIEELVLLWGSSNWVNDSKTIYTYDVNNNLIEKLRLDWDGSHYVNQDRSLYTYDVNDNLIEELVLLWDGSNWVNYYRSLYTYDVNDNLIEELVVLWGGFIWENYGKILYTYDVNNNLIEELVLLWDVFTWVNGYKYTYYYIPTGIEQIEGEVNTYSLSDNYPNPFNPSTTISYSVPEIEFVTLKVYDVLGSEIVTLVNEEKPVGGYEVDFNASELSSGVYFYKLQAGNFIQTKKMVLMK